jgi:hypothetical protein
MPYQLKPAVPKVPELPEKQTIVIGGVDCGECEPSLQCNELRWHAVIRLRGKTAVSVTALVQGFGDTPEQAIADSIVRFRKEQRDVAERMEWLETQLGTLGKADEDVAQVVGKAGSDQ